MNSTLLDDIRWSLPIFHLHLVQGFLSNRQEITACSSWISKQCCTMTSGNPPENVNVKPLEYKGTSSRVKKRWTSRWRLEIRVSNDQVVQLITYLDYVPSIYIVVCTSYVCEPVFVFIIRWKLHIITLMWLKQCHKPSPSHHHFLRWYVYHSQMDGLWHCFSHMILYACTVRHQAWLIKPWKVWLGLTPGHCDQESAQKITENLGAHTKYIPQHKYTNI